MPARKVDDARFAASARGVVITDVEGKVVRTGSLPEGWESLRPGEPIQALVHPDDLDPAELRALADARVHRLCLECRIVTADGELRQALCLGSRSSHDPGCLLFALEDITGLRVSAEAAASYGLLDPDTGLPGRLLHDNRLQHALRADAEAERVTALLRLHVPALDDPAAVRLVARAVESAVPAAATVTHMGLGEFSVLLPGLDGEPDVWAAADRVRSSVRPFGEPLIGFAVSAPGERLGAADLIRQSVRSAYAPWPAKGRGGRGAARPGLIAALAAALVGAPLSISRSARRRTRLRLPGR